MTYVRDKESFPYRPINDLEQIKNELNDKYQQGGLAGLAEITDYWIGEIEKYNLRFNREESRAISKVLLDYWSQLPCSDDGFENDYVDMIKQTLLSGNNSNLMN